MKSNALKMSIRWKLLSTMIGFIVVFVAILTSIQIAAQKSLLESELEKRSALMREKLIDHGKILTDNLLTQVQNGVAAFNLSMVNEVLKKAVADDKAMSYAILMNTSGTAYLHTLKPELEQETLSGKQDIYAREQQKFAINEYESDGKAFMEFIAPVQISTQPWGALRLGISMERLNTEILESRKEIARQTRQMVIRSIIISLICITAGAGIIVLISNKLSRPLTDLTKVANELAKGNFEAGVNARADSGDEIGVLAVAFSGMAKELKSSYEKQKEHSHTLEQKVALKTEEHRKAREQAESATKLKDQFVALISHDLRSPLLSIKGMLDMAKTENHKGLREMDKNRTFDRIAKSTEGLIALIERLLDHNRLQTGSIKPEMRFINIRSLVEEQIDKMSHLASVKNITLRNTLPEAMHLYADPDLYGQVIHNLLSNAIKFTYRGGEITILPTGESSFVVRDNGVGIDEKMLPDLFSIGVKTTTYGTDGERGNGLGLPYSHDIIKAHGGSLTAVPIKGAGAEFHITLPRHDTIVLIVDDQDIQRAIMKDMLAKLNGVQVVEAHNGAEALEMLQHIMPAIIITDIQMPVMDGFELVRRIRSLQQYEMVPIMAVTAFAGADPGELREKLLTLGADDFIAKPLAEEEFLPVVARYLGIA